MFGLPTTQEQPRLDLRPLLELALRFLFNNQMDRHDVPIASLMLLINNNVSVKRSTKAVESHIASFDELQLIDLVRKLKALHRSGLH